MKIVLYSQNSCGPCKMIKQLLKSKNINYEEENDLSVMLSKAITKTPTLEVDGELIRDTKEIMNWVNKQ